MDLAPQAVLHWDRGALETECDRAALVRAGVEAYLGRSVFAAEGSVVVRVTLSRVVEPGSAHVVATVHQEDASGRHWGERSVIGDESCASLDEPLTLVVALMVDAPPVAKDAAEPQGPPEPAAPQPAAPQPTPTSPEPEPSDETGEILTAPSLARLAVSPGHAAFLGLGLVSMGALPSAALGAGAFVSVKPRGFGGFGLQAGALAPQRQTLASGSLETSLIAMGVSLCPLQGINDDTWWSACGTLGVARLRVKSRDLLAAKAQSEWLTLPSLNARAAWRVSSGWLLGAGLEAAFPVSPDRYVYRDAEGGRHLAFEMSQLVVTANLGVGVLLH